MVQQGSALVQILKRMALETRVSRGHNKSGLLGRTKWEPSAERRRVPDVAWDPGRGFRSWLQKLELRHVPNFDPRAAVTTVHVSCVVYLFL